MLHIIVDFPAKDSSRLPNVNHYIVEVVCANPLKSYRSLFSPQPPSQIIQIFAQEFENNKQKRNEFNILRMLFRSNYDLASNTIFPVNFLFISSNIPAA